MRIPTILCLCLGVLCGGSSCRKQDPPQAPAKTVVAVIPKGTTHEFWKSIHAGAVRAARETGVEILWKGPQKEDDRDEQIKVVEDMIIRGVAGIVLAPLDDVALGAPVAAATRVDIPVVVIDSGLRSTDQVSFVATDNRKGGYRGGKKLAELLGGKGEVLLLRYQVGSASTTNREQGFLDAMAEHPELHVASSDQYGGATTESAMKAAEHLLARYRKGDGALTVDGIFCPNESTTFGMLRALKDSGLAGKVKFVGFDSSTELVKALAAGQLHALVLQDPMNMGYLGVKTLVAHLRGETVSPQIDTGSTVATPDNMHDPKAARLLKPDFKKWLQE